jgi:ankyrin repeat protein
MAENNDGVVVTEVMLTEAAGTGDLERLTVWARQGVRVTSAEPLCIAVEGGHVEVLRCLVQKLGADVNQGGIEGFTALLDAANHGHLAVVRCLIQFGASVGGTSNDGTTALHIAALNGELDIERYLVKLGAEVGTADNDGQTPLLLSALSGRYPTTQYLLEKAGANMDDVTNEEKTVWDQLTVHFEDNIEYEE